MVETIASPKRKEQEMMSEKELGAEHERPF